MNFACTDCAAFETIEDLDNSYDTMKKYLSLPIAQKWIALMTIIKKSCWLFGQQ